MSRLHLACVVRNGAAYLVSTYVRAHPHLARPQMCPRGVAEGVADAQRRLAGPKTRGEAQGQGAHRRRGRWQGDGLEGCDGQGGQHTTPARGGCGDGQAREGALTETATLRTTRGHRSFSRFSSSFGN